MLPIRWTVGQTYRTMDTPGAHDGRRARWSTSINTILRAASDRRGHGVAGPEEMANSIRSWQVAPRDSCCRLYRRIELGIDPETFYRRL